MDRQLHSIGQSLVELALTLPLLILIILGSADLGRVFYANVTLAGAVHKGAMYASSSIGAAADESGIRSAVLADATTLFDLSPTNPTVTSTVGADPYGFNYVAVTVTYQFRPILPYPGLPGAFTIGHSTQMRVKP